MGALVEHWRELFFIQIGATVFVSLLLALTFRLMVRKSQRLLDLEERLRAAEHDRDMERLNSERVMHTSESYERLLHTADFLRHQNQRLVECIQTQFPDCAVCKMVDRSATVEESSR